MVVKVDIPPDNRHEYTGLSTDTKPLAGDGSLFYELDTEDIYYAMYGNWWKVGTEATPPSQNVTVRLFEATVTTEQQATYYKCYLDMPFHALHEGFNEGVEFIVEFDGVEYSTFTKPVTTPGNMSTTGLGGDFSDGIPDFSEYPFILTAYELYTSEGGEHTIRVYLDDVPTVKLTLVAELGEGNVIYFSGNIIADGAWDAEEKELDSGTYNYTLADLSDVAVVTGVAWVDADYPIECTVEGGYEDDGAICPNEGSTEIHLTVTTSGGGNNQ